MTKCKCGEPLMIITDPDIIGREGIIWHVCPLILYGDTERDHTSICEEENVQKNTMSYVPEIC